MLFEPVRRELRPQEVPDDHFSLKAVTVSAGFRFLMPLWTPALSWVPVLLSALCIQMDGLISGDTVLALCPVVGRCKPRPHR